MKDAVLAELARRWIVEAKTPDCVDGSEDAKIGNAKAQGYRECKRECADTLLTLIQILGNAEGES